MCLHQPAGSLSDFRLTFERWRFKSVGQGSDCQRATGCDLPRFEKPLVLALVKVGQVKPKIELELVVVRLDVRAQLIERSVVVRFFQMR